MVITRWSPSWDPFAELDEMVRRLPVPFGRNDMSAPFIPALDVYEEKDAIVVETPLAGVDPKDVEVSVDKGMLTIQGKTTREHEIDEKNYYRKEVRNGSFYRQVALPGSVKEDQVDAEFKNGILKITCPKADRKEVKKISVKVVEKK